MRKFVLAAIGVLALSSAAHAALVLHVQDVTVAGSASAQTVTLDVWVEETDGSQANISAFAVPLRLADGGPLTFTGNSAFNPVGRAVFGASSSPNPGNATNLTDLDPYFAPYDRYLRDDFTVTVQDEEGNDIEQTVETQIVNGSKDGLFRVSINVPALTIGTFNVNVDTNETYFEISDKDGALYTSASAVPLIIDHGVITVNPIPEPSAMALGLIALPLLARRRR